MSFKKKILIIIITSLFIIQLIAGAISFYCIFNTRIDWEKFSKNFEFLASFVSSPNKPVEKQEEFKNKDTNELEKLIAKSFTEENKRWSQTITWLKENQKKIKNVKIKSIDDITLTGSMIKNDTIENNKNWIILAHGYQAEASDNITFGKCFYDMGFNILLINQRGYGTSEGEYTTLGYKERLDIKKWIEYIAKTYPDSNIATWGISMGAASVLMACGEDLPKNFKLCIADCSFNSLYDLLTYLSNTMIGIPYLIARYILFGTYIIGKFHGTDIALSVEDYLKKAKVPILFLHGKNDTFVPLNSSKPMYISSNTYNEKHSNEMEEFDFSGHCLSSVINYDRYWNKVKEFTRKHMDFSKFDQLKDEEEEIAENTKK